jgi:hypothetical protein
VIARLLLALMLSVAAPSGVTPIWAPLPGSQAVFLSCPVWECLYEGTRGPGKTDALIWDFAKDIGQGHGAAWRGILFRESYPQLADVEARTRRWFHQAYPDARYNASSHTWTWPDGESLLLRYIETPSDYWNYHGHEYPWMGFEELTNWPDLECYDAMKACNRSSVVGVPRRIRSTANPFGIGHHAVKARFIDPAPAGVVIRNAEGLERVRITGHWSENTVMLAADPDYPKRLASDENAHRRRAWLHGDWDIVAGGFFDDVFDRTVHAVKPFAIPGSWRLNRSFDWGSARPFSVGWWAESDGSPVTLEDGKLRHYARGTLFRVAEWYGSTGKPNEGLRMRSADIARGIREREQMHPLLKGRVVLPGPADSSIYDAEDGVSIADTMQQYGVRWVPADKRPGSRKIGWEQLRARLVAAAKAPREEAGLFVFDTCTQWLRTVPVLPRDEKKPDDVDTNAEDHIGDETRYRVLETKLTITHSRFIA